MEFGIWSLEFWNSLVDARALFLVNACSLSVNALTPKLQTPNYKLVGLGTIVSVVHFLSQLLENLHTQQTADSSLASI